MIHTPKNNRMKQEEIRLLYQRFEQMACVSGDVECWSVRELWELTDV